MENKKKSLVQLLFNLIELLHPNISGYFSFLLWTKTKRYQFKKKEDVLLKRSISETIVINKKKVRLYSWGEGKTILIVHGWCSRATHFHDLINQLVLVGFQVISFDAPGHGKSKGKKTDLNEYQTIITHLANQYGCFECAIGHSLGTVAICMALNKDQLNTKKTILISPPSTWYGLLEKYQIILGLSMQAFKDLQRRIEYYYADKNIWKATSLVDIAATIENIPCLILHDKNDMEIPYNEGKSVADAWKQATLITTRDLGHKSIIKHPEVINSIGSFIKNSAI